MDQGTLRHWDEMLDEFRALGGTAENIRLAEGAFGRGLFPIDPALPVMLRIPDALLVDVKHVEFENGAFRVGAGAGIGARERAFLENYQREFSWGLCREEIESLLQMTHAAPAELRELIRTSFNGGRWLAEPTAESVQERFFDSRVIRYKDSDVIMPIVELANHGHTARYEVDDGVGLSGQFAGEILVRYELCDPLQIFGKWGFASGGEAFGLSLQMKLGTLGIVIGRGDVKLEDGRRPFFPDVSVQGGDLSLSYMMLGHRNFPRLARGNFYRIMRDAGRSDAEEAFDMIQHINRMELYKLDAASEGAAPELGRLLRDFARFQLDAISHYFGVRDV
jgi:hypothetical protein